MGKKLAIALLAMILLVPFNLPAQTPVDSYCLPTRSLKEKNVAFKGGEALDYVFHYQWGAINSDVAKATVRLDTLTYNGVPAFHCRVFGKTAKFYDVFFKVREDFQSWFTRDGLRPLRFTRETNEGSYEARNTYRFVRDGRDDHISADLYSSRRGHRTKSLPLTPCTYDIISLYFTARNIDINKIKVGTPYPMTFAIDDDVYNVTLTYHGKETKRIKGIGKIRCLKVSFGLIGGEVFDEGSEMLCWISDDENRIPISFECSIKVGKVTGRVEAYSGLKYPFKSLIEK